jgi:hypothetical protein
MLLSTMTSLTHTHFLSVSCCVCHLLTPPHESQKFPLQGRPLPQDITTVRSCSCPRRTGAWMMLTNYQRGGASAGVPWRIMPILGYGYWFDSRSAREAGGRWRGRPAARETGDGCDPTGGEAEQRASRLVAAGTCGSSRPDQRRRRPAGACGPSSWVGDLGRRSAAVVGSNAGGQESRAVVSVMNLAARTKCDGFDPLNRMATKRMLHRANQHPKLVEAA